MISQSLSRRLYAAAFGAIGGAVVGFLAAWCIKAVTGDLESDPLGFPMRQWVGAGAVVFGFFALVRGTFIGAMLTDDDDDRDPGPAGSLFWFVGLLGFLIGVGLIGFEALRHAK